jgi:hypothetical protein
MPFFSDPFLCSSNDACAGIRVNASTARFSVIRSAGDQPPSGSPSAVVLATAA